MRVGVGTDNQCPSCGYRLSIQESPDSDHELSLENQKTPLEFDDGDSNKIRIHTKRSDLIFDSPSQRLARKATWRRRGQNHVLRFLITLVVIGFVSATTAILLRGFTEAFKVSLLWVFFTGVSSSLFGGIGGFFLCYFPLKPRHLVNLAQGVDVMSPRTAAYFIGAPSGVVLSSWIVVGLDNGLTWEHWICLLVAFFSLFICIISGLASPSKLDELESKAESK